MDFSQLVKDYESKSSGVPEEYADRTVMKASEIAGTFTNDEPIIIIRKPKNFKDEDTGKWERVKNKEGKAIFQDVAYIPALLDDGTSAVIVTATDETVRVVRMIMGDQVPVRVKGESDDDINRWEKFTAPEVIEGKLKFGPVKKEYRNGKTYPVAVLQQA